MKTAGNHCAVACSVLTLFIIRVSDMKLLTLEELLSKAKALDKLSVTLDILALDVSKHISSLTNHLKKTSS